MRKILVLLLCLGLSGCATTHNFSNILINKNPQIQVIKDPDISISNYQTFSILPLADTSIGNGANRIIEKQMLFVVRNVLEAQGYIYKQDIKDADFTVAIHFNQEYKTHYVPPEMITVPHFVTGWTSTYNFNYHGSFSGWGSGTIAFPGYWTTQTYIRPGYFVGHYYPVIAVHIIDNKIKNSVWEGLGVTYSDNSDIRLSCQVLFSQILAKFPEGKLYNRDYSPEWNRLGMSILIMTNEGNDFYPSIAIVWDGSPAKKAGLKRYDIITEIDGEGTLNKPLSEIREIIENIKTERVELTIKRLDKVMKGQVPL